MCLSGASGAGAELLAAVPHPGLRVHYVWAPVLPPDDRAAAEAAAERLAEPRPDGRPSGRARHYWDGERRLAQRLGESLGISAKESLGIEGGTGLAWDVYLAYERGASDLFRPTFWMHQLGVTHAPRLDAAAFRQQVEGLLGA
jgi:hypothetical protein